MNGNSVRNSIAAFAGLMLTYGAETWAYSDYSSCETCHGGYTTPFYTSLQDNTAWGTSLHTAHQDFVGGECTACHLTPGSVPVSLNESGDSSFSKGCVGCHGRDEDVTGNCVGGGGVPAECGSAAGLRIVHESKAGIGTCNGCHVGDSTPVGEDANPFNYSIGESIVKNSCDADGTESQFGPTGLDNDGDGQRDANDPDCQAASTFVINAGLNDAWVSAGAPLQGFFFTVFPDIGFFFLSWFTFDSVPPASDTATFGASDQRWVTGGGAYSGNTVTVSVELTSGGIFNGSDPMPAQTSGYGTITIEFVGCNEATLSYDFPSLGLSGQMTLTRAVTDNVALCEMLAAP